MPNEEYPAPCTRRVPPFRDSGRCACGESDSALRAADLSRSDSAQIVVHEMVHMLEPTHNARFVALMDRLIPQWRVCREQLNQLPVRHEKWIYGAALASKCESINLAGYHRKLNLSSIVPISCWFRQS